MTTAKCDAPRDILNHWMRAVGDKDIEALLALYDPRAVLIPTFSNRMLSKPEAIRAYFEALCQRDELSIALHEKTLSILPYHDQIVSMHGIYCWRFAIDDELLSFEARFTYLVDMNLPSPIMHHHSSQIPRTL